MNYQLMWFRNDLRVNDNPALHNAALSGKPIIAIYIATPNQWQQHDDSPNKIDFWQRNLSVLKKSLSPLNISLHFFEVANYQDIAPLITRICQKWPIAAIHFNEEYPVNEQQRDLSVTHACDAMGVSCNSYVDQLLLPPKSIRNKAGEPFKVFTPFSKQIRQQLPHSFHLLPPPSIQTPIKLPALAEEKQLEQLSWPTVDKTIQELWPAGEDVAADNLANFCQTSSIHDYQKDRDLPFVRGTSFLSPYLVSGVISVRQCWQATLTYCEQSDGVRVWQSELLWREFYKHVLIDFPHVSKHKPWKPHTDGIAWRNDEKELKAWQQGKTGYPIIDAAMKQLLTTGWMHNRLRMITAMFLSKHLLIDWRLGEQWFMQHLIDGELAANNGGWQWSASTGTDAVPYFRIFNPVTQSQRFDQWGQFIRCLLPELSSLDDREIHLPKANKPNDYPEPIVDLAFGRKRALEAFKNLASPS
jgi:deoxyribodipyrimidine photo-lyase